MKTRNGFVSNSSSSSFILLRDILSEKQFDMIVDYEEWVKFFIELDQKKGSPEKLNDRFSYYDDSWRIVVNDDYIFGETSMDNFSMYDYFDFIGVDQDFVSWDDGYNDEPYSSQLEFIKKMKVKIRKNKIDKINNNLEE